ncbi:MAG TPA: hypothetical protein VNI54_11010 [Thermoanaerobaculia bacterium]|nr:hypothetical protein [Thermoanaerobaculia bacterium]
MAAAQGKRAARLGDVIDGSKQPELYFVTELFEILVSSSFVTLPHAYPHVVRERSSDLFLEPAEWKAFTDIVADYARVLREQRAAAASSDRPAVSDLQALKCVEGAKALRNARQTFGRHRFDRMLYEVVPVGIRTTFSVDTDFEKAALAAREREERCQ